MDQALVGAHRHLRGREDQPGRMWEEGGGRRSGGEMGPVSLRGGWGRGGVTMFKMGPPKVRGLAGRGRDPQGMGD